jgi:hypothetical protein
MIMEIKLDDDEIREILAEAIAKKLSYLVMEIPPDECWFECKAGNIESELEDINSVKFCYQSP